MTRFNEWYRKRILLEIGEETPEEEPQEPQNQFPIQPNEKNLGRLVRHHFKVWQIRFADIKHDAQEGWYYVWSDTPGSSSIANLEDLQMGDKVADVALNMTPYWEISGVDERTEKVFLRPIEPNPFVTGVGAGGMPIGQHDYDVMSGEYERERADQILKAWKDELISAPRDVAYLLLGTVQTNVGPNGAQGGWYNVSDTWSNRGGRRGMKCYEIMFADAMTLKHKFGFDVPKRALVQPSGDDEVDAERMLKPDVWNDFVSGGGNQDHRDLAGTEIEGEDFDDPETCAKMVIEHPQSNIKTRNAIRLVKLFRYKDDRMLGKGAISNTKNRRRREQKFKKWLVGRGSRREIEPLIKETAAKLAGITHPKQEKLGSYDPYYLAKEAFIVLAAQMGWTDVLQLYENSPDGDNRRYVFDAYRGRFVKRPPNLEGMWRMLDKEEHPDNLKRFIEDIMSIDPAHLKQWLETNAERLSAIADEWKGKGAYSFFGKELEGAIKRVRDSLQRTGPDIWKHWH